MYTIGMQDQKAALDIFTWVTQELYSPLHQDTDVWSWTELLGLFPLDFRGWVTIYLTLRNQSGRNNLYLKSILACRIGKSAGTKRYL